MRCWSGREAEREEEEEKRREKYFALERWDSARIREGWGQDSAGIVGEVSCIVDKS